MTDCLSKPSEKLEKNEAKAEEIKNDKSEATKTEKKEKAEEEAKPEDKAEKEQDENCFLEAIKAFSVGAVSGYIGAYIENVIANILEKKENIFAVTGSDNEYLTDVITGAVFTYLFPKLNLPQQAVFGSGLNYAVLQGLENSSGKKGLSDREFADNFLIDVVVILGILFLQKKFTEAFSIPDIKPKTFGGAVLKDLLEGLPVTIYFGIRDFLFAGQNEENNGSSKENPDQDNEKKGVTCN